jgi:Asp/Glu/hydantoin racemase
MAIQAPRVIENWLRTTSKCSKSNARYAKKCIELDGAGSFIFSCAGMSDIKEQIERYLKVPVIADVASAIKIAIEFYIQGCL